MNVVNTMCARDCYDACFLKVSTDGGDHGDVRVTDVAGDPQNPITGTNTCPRGAGDVRHIYENRVLFPFLRNGGKPGRDFGRTSWDNALGRVTERLKQTIDTHGKDSVLLLDYSGNTGLLSSRFPHRLWNALGTARTDGTLCNASGVVGLRLHYGETYGIQPMELPDRDLIVFWGFNAPAVSSHVWRLAMGAAKKKGARVMVVDPYRCRAAREAHRHFQIHPGSDVALAMGICRYLILNRMVDMDFIEKETSGFEELKAEALTWTPDRVLKETGLADSEVEELALAYGRSKNSATMIGFGLQKHINGADQVRAISFLPALRGLHRGFFYSNSDAYSLAKSYLSGFPSTGDPSTEHHKIVSQVGLGPLVRRGDFKFIFVYGMNPAQTLTGLGDFRAGLLREDTFLVVHDTHWTETTDYADVVLPACTFYEKLDVVVSFLHPYVRLMRPVIPPLGESRDEVAVMAGMARGLGLVDPVFYEPPLQVLEKTFEGAFSNGNFGDFREGRTMELKRKSIRRYGTPGGKIEFFSTVARARGIDPLPRHRSRTPGVGEFILLNCASVNYTNSQFREVYGDIPAEVTVNPRDAERLGIVGGDRVVLSNGLGSVEVRAVVSDAVAVGVLWAPRQLTGLDNTPLNVLTGSTSQAVGGGPMFNSTPVSLGRPGKD